MKILTWNSAMRFREKIKLITPLSADIVVIPECEAPEKWLKTKNIEKPEQFLWFGNNVNKGIGVMTLNTDYTIVVHNSYNPIYEFIIPIQVTGKTEFNMLAIWSQKTKDRYYSYIGQIYQALEYYKEFLDGPCILIGDWNSNKTFDHVKRIGTHSDVVKILQEKDIHSVYHYFFNEEHGCETKPTYYFRKDKDNPFHIDFIFASDSLLNILTKLSVGKYHDWIKFSDHLPLIAEFQIDKSQNIKKLLEYHKYFNSNKPKYVIANDNLVDPYIYSNEVTNFINDLYAQSFILSNFDWNDWLINSEEYVSNKALIMKADVETLKKLLTCYVRQDRYNSGSIARLIDEGIIRIVLKRIEEITISK